MSVPNEKLDGGFEDVPVTKQEPYTQPNAYELANDQEQTITGSPRTSTDLTSMPSKNDLAESLDPVYAAKATVLNNALNEIGMGRYQWELFCLVAFGWASDNSWLIVTSLILAPVANEFNPSTPTFLTLAQNIGLCFGAFFWGFGCDIIGRKWAFNCTLGIAAVFGLCAAGSPTFAAVCVFDALWSVGVGGNLPVDSAIFLEFLPGSHQYLLVVLSTFWALAQLIANLVAWPVLGNFTCEQGAATCTRSENMGWRYYLLIMGGIGMIMFILRFFCFNLQEPPKYLMGKGRDAEAVKVIHAVAKKNGKTCDLTLEDLQKCENLFVGPTDGAGSPEDEIKKKMARSGESEKLDLHHVKALFCDKKTAWSTTLLIIIWGLIGLGFPLYNAFLPYIQASKGVEFGDGSTNTTYLYTVYIALAGIPGACTGAFLVELPRLGRKGALSASTFMTGAFLVGSTFATSSKALLGWNCAYCFSQNIMYAVLYASTPETFPTLHRGTGNALVGTANRIMGILAPIIAMVAGLEQSSPIVYTAAGLFGLASIITLFLPFETRGKMSM